MRRDPRQSTRKEDLRNDREQLAFSAKELAKAFLRPKRLILAGRELAGDAKTCGNTKDIGSLEKKINLYSVGTQWSIANSNPRQLHYI